MASPRATSRRFRSSIAPSRPIFCSPRFSLARSRSRSGDSMSPRIVSLLPSATEIVCALGLESALVGRSHECDFPHGIERLPVCTSPKVGGRDTREIHDSVSAILKHDISVYDVDAELLRELAPTHVITQIQCDVCAVSLRDVEAALADWSGVSAPRIVGLNPTSLDDVFDDIRRAGDALD